MKALSVKPVRCAIYTRVSTEYGLDQEFNSLDAQYDAASAYIKSQAHAGWTLTRSRYDDGGYSGGSSDRPDLFESLDGCQRLSGRLSKVLAGTASLTRSASAARVSKSGWGLAPTAATQMRPQQEPSTQEVLAGFVERVTFHNSENGFCVLRAKARGHRDLVTVIGHAAAISAGEWITASGEWVNDHTHGQQFKARFMRTSAPTSIEGIEKYLGSGMIRGIGPVYAKKLVRAFGEKVFDTIEAEPQRLREVTGIGLVRAKRITDAWAEQKIIREIMVFLHTNGVGTARAVRIYKTYGADAVQVMTENPYRLARDIRGIGFKTADAIAMKLGIEKTAMIRVRAGISYALTDAMDEGHCGLPTDELVPLAEKLLEGPQQLIRTALELELQEGTVVADRVGETPCVFLAGLHRAERMIADRLTRLASGTLPWPWIDPAKALPWVEKHIGLAIAESQGATIPLALTTK